MFIRDMFMRSRALRNTMHILNIYIKRAVQGPFYVYKGLYIKTAPLKGAVSATYAAGILISILF